jgi:hypothetical protein
LTNVPMDWSQTGPVFPIAPSNARCTIDVQCATGGIDPHFRRPKTLQWSVDLQKAITNDLTIDVAYAGNHGYDENYSTQLNSVPVGTGYTPAVISACLATDPYTTSARSIASACKVDQDAINNARPYHTAFPYLGYVNSTTYGFKSNYNGLQVTLADPVNDFYAPYSSSSQDIRHRFRFSPSWDLPGISSPGQMLEGWRVSAVLAIQGRFPWASIDKTRTDWVGTGEAFNSYSPSPNNGALQFWNFSGDPDAFNINFDTMRVGEVGRIPCYGNVSSSSNCTRFSSAPASIVALCENAAQAPYQGNPQLMALALRALYANADGCYVKNGGVLTPPAYGTNGNSGRNSFRGPKYNNVDLTVAKTWHMGERYSAELRTEVYNLFNTPSLGIPSQNGSAPSSGNFGRVNSTADGSNNIFGSGGPRHLQFGLKLTF